MRLENEPQANVKRYDTLQLKVARFPVYRDLAGFDFAQSEVNEALVRQLHRCEFLEPAQNVGVQDQEVIHNVSP